MNLARALMAVTGRVKLGFVHICVPNDSSKKKMALPMSLQGGKRTEGLFQDSKGQEITH